MIRAIIIEDEPAGQDALIKLLTKACPNVTVVASAGSVENGVKVIDQHRPDLVFLDVELAGGSGFMLLEQVANRSFQVIVTTAYEHYALRAVKSSALDYLLKPIDEAELVAAVAKLSSRSAVDGKDSIEQLLQTLQRGALGRPQLALPTGEGVVLVAAAEVVRCEASGNTTVVHLTSGRSVKVSRSLKFYEDLLTSDGFFRVHSHHLINLRQMRAYLRMDGGTAKMSDGGLIPVSRRRREEFADALARETRGLRLGAGEE